MAKLIKRITAIVVIFTILFISLYCFTSKALFLTLAITFGTTSYHFVMRLLVAYFYNSFINNKINYRNKWFSVSVREQQFYEKLGIKKWKNKMPTYDPRGFDVKNHSLDEIAQTMCQAELGHETIVLLSFLPILAGRWFGAYPVFIVTSVMAAIFVPSLLLCSGIIARGL